MTSLRQAAQQALEALTNCTSEYGHRCNRCDSEVDEGGKVVEALRAALAEPVQEPVDVGNFEYRGNSVGYIYQKMTAYRNSIDAAWDALRAKGIHPDGKTRLAEAIARHTAPPQAVLQSQGIRSGDATPNPDLGCDTGGTAPDLAPGGATMTTLRTAAQQALEALCCVRDMVAHPDNLEFIDKHAAALRAALAEPVQEPVAWMTHGNDSLPLFHRTRAGALAWGAEPQPLYTAPPQRKPLSDADLAKIWDDALDQLDPRDQLRFIARAIERAHGIKE